MRGPSPYVHYISESCKYIEYVIKVTNHELHHRNYDIEVKINNELNTIIDFMKLKKQLKVPVKVVW